MIFGIWIILAAIGWWLAIDDDSQEARCSFSDAGRTKES